MEDNGKSKFSYFNRDEDLKKVNQYTIVITSNDQAKFSNLINERLALGWKLLGDLKIYTLGSNGQYLLVREMVKYEKNDKT